MIHRRPLGRHPSARLPARRHPAGPHYRTPPIPTESYSDTITPSSQTSPSVIPAMLPCRLYTCLATPENAHTRRFPACRAVLEATAHRPVPYMSRQRLFPCNFPSAVEVVRAMLARIPMKRDRQGQWPSAPPALLSRRPGGRVRERRGRVGQGPGSKQVQPT
jgi:hypothetical protein